MPNKPNLFIVGAPKAGTSFLYKKLYQHPDLYFPRVKELNHFSYSDILELGSYYKDFKIKEFQRYIDFYKKAENQKYLVDCSVSYFAFSNVAKKLYEFNPDAKIVIILRNPIKRAFSHYNMDVRMGYAKSPFEEYIRQDQKGEAHYHQYVENSLYYKQIKRYYKVFGKEKVCVLFLENIKSDIVKLYDFLSISKEAIKIDFNERVNKSKTPKNLISRKLQKNRALTSKLKLVIPQYLVDKFNGILYKEEEKSELNKKDYETLSKYFKEDAEKLKSLLQIPDALPWG